MSMYFGLAAVKELKKKRKKKKKKKKEKEKEKEGGRRSIVKADSRSAAASFGEMVLMEIPEEVLMEILVRLPVNSLMRFKCVSKLWYSLISCRYFTNLFFKVSSPRREGRVFMCVVDLNLINKYVLFSASSGNREASASFPKLNQDLTLPGMRGHLVNALRGLMCFRIGREVRIYNFTTRQVVSLPKVRSNMLEGDSHMWNYFGHDPVNDEYKVVSKVWSVSEELKRLRSETQVFVLGAGASWRNTRTCSSPPISHRPYSQGISINGVLYYGIWSPGKRCVMSFDLTSEDFNLIDLPVEANIIWRVSQANLMNYRGKLAVFECSRLATECILDLWVVEDAGKSKWSHKVFVLPCHQLRQSLGITDMLLIRGTSLSGKIRLSARILDGSKISKHAIYDLETNRVTQGVVIKPLYPKFFSRAASLQTTLWDDVESIMYLEA